MSGCIAYDETGNICTEISNFIVDVDREYWKGKLCQRHYLKFLTNKNVQPEGCEECDYSKLFEHNCLLYCAPIQTKYDLIDHETTRPICAVNQIGNKRTDNMPFIRPPPWCPILCEFGITYDEEIEISKLCE